MIDHVCDKCGKQLDPVNWWTASVGDRYGGRSYKLCGECAELADSTLQAMMSGEGRVRKAVER